MKKNLLGVVLSALLFTNLLQAQTIWNGPTTTFTKVSGADPTLPANQDRITASTWITRGTTRGIYNAVTETGYTDFVSPANTRWATGTLGNYSTLTYQTWENWNGSNPPSTVGTPAVMHLISENIYIGITFTAWGAGLGGGGSFSYQRTTAPIAAPVKLISFVASKKDNKLQLSWKTASEENTSNFSIERSSDGKLFSSIGTIQAAGNSNSEKTYSFIDANPSPSNFYRLKTIDNNGTFNYSSIVAYKFGTIKSLELFPIPASSVLRIQLNTLTETSLQIVDIGGRILKTKLLAEGNNAFNLAIDDLKPGTYFLRIGDQSKMFVKE